MLPRSLLVLPVLVLALASYGQEPQQPTDPTAPIEAAVSEPPAPPASSATGGQPAAQFPSAGEHSGAVLTYRIIDAPNGTFGYDILSNGRLFVHQTNVPGMPGIEGCHTREQAEQLAQFVIGKVQKGEMPPTVTAEELKALNIR